MSIDLRRRFGQRLDRLHLPADDREDLERLDDERADEVVGAREVLTGGLEVAEADAPGDRVRGQPGLGALEPVDAAVHVAASHDEHGADGHDPDDDDGKHDECDPPAPATRSRDLAG